MPQFPILPGQTFITTKQPQWSTRRAEAFSGRERRQKNWSYPRWLFNFSYEFLRNNVTQNELNTLQVFYNSLAGSYGEFEFLDPEDNSVTDMVFAVGTGTQTSFKLNKTTTAGGVTFNEPVLAIKGTPVFKVNGTAVSATVQDYGVITFVSAPALNSSITWSGQYMYKCRFNSDELAFSQFASLLWSVDGLEFISVKR